MNYAFKALLSNRNVFEPHQVQGVLRFTSLTFSHSVNALNSFCVVQYGSSHTCSHVKHWKVMRRCFSLHELNGVTHTCMCSLTLLLLYTHTTVLSVFCCIVSFGQNSVGGRFCPQPAIQVIKLATVTSDIVCISPPENL